MNTLYITVEKCREQPMEQLCHYRYTPSAISVNMGMMQRMTARNMITFPS